MTELEKELLKALEQMQAERKQDNQALRQMFEYTAGQSERQRSLQELVRAYEFNRPDP